MSDQTRLDDLERRLKKLEDAIGQADRPATIRNPERKLSIGEFLATRKLEDDVKRTLAIAYFLDYFEKVNSFNTDDIKKGFRMARLPIPANVNDKINMSIKNGHLAEEREKKASKKAWYVTNTGATFVEETLSK